MKRLFEVNGAYFDQKEDAKKARGDGKPVLAEDGPNKGKVMYVSYKHTVKLGPDHRNYR